MTRIALIDYGSGNIHSAKRALVEAASLADCNRDILVTADPEEVIKADAIVLPGVGHFADCAANLNSKSGLVEALSETVSKQGKPFLGICVGMQLLADVGLEDGETPGLGWIPGKVSKIDPGQGYRIPHMGWNQIEPSTKHPILDGLGDEPHVYFTHSYIFRTQDTSDVSAMTTYGESFTAAVAKENIFGTQFHPEKSQKVGLKILSNFMTWEP